jgi:hypothetical protein
MEPLNDSMIETCTTYFDINDIQNMIAGPDSYLFGYGLLWHVLSVPADMSDYAYQDLINIDETMNGCHSNTTISAHNLDSTVRDYLYVAIQRIRAFAPYHRDTTIRQKYEPIINFLSCFHAHLFNHPTCVDEISLMLVHLLFASVFPDYSYHTNLRTVVLKIQTLRDSDVVKRIIDSATCILRNYIACERVRIHKSTTFDYAEFLSNNGFVNLVRTLVIHKQTNITDIVKRNPLLRLNSDEYRCKNTCEDVSIIERNVQLRLSVNHCLYLCTIYTKVLADSNRRQSH